MSWEFLVTTVFVVLLPGTGVLFTIAIGLGSGTRASIAAAFGYTMGILPAALASIIGLSAVLHQSALAYQFLKYLGVLYLLYLAWQVWRTPLIFEPDEKIAKITAWRIAISGFLLNILNPKLSAFFLAFLPQFVSPTQPDATSVLFLHAGVFMAVTFVAFCGYGAMAARMRQNVLHSPRIMAWLKRSFAAAFAYLGAKLALSG